MIERLESEIHEQAEKHRKGEVGGEPLPGPATDDSLGVGPFFSCRQCQHKAATSDAHLCSSMVRFGNPAHSFKTYSEFSAPLLSP